MYGFNPMVMLNAMIQKNPQLSQYWNTAQKMAQGKSPEQISQIASNLAKQNGMDINQVAQQAKRFMSGGFNGF